MRLKLPEHLIQKLRNLSESGMGYHNVTVTFVDGSSISTTALNGEWLELPTEKKYVQEIVDINKEID